MKFKDIIHTLRFAFLLTALYYTAELIVLLSLIRANTDGEFEATNFSFIKIIDANGNNILPSFTAIEKGIFIGVLFSAYVLLGLVPYIWAWLIKDKNDYSNILDNNI